MRFASFASVGQASARSAALEVDLLTQPGGQQAPGSRLRQAPHRSATLRLLQLQDRPARFGAPMTLKYWTASPLQPRPASPPSIETLVLHNHLRSTGRAPMTRLEAAAAAPADGALARPRSLSSTWNDLDAGAGAMDAFDASATLPAPSTAAPAMWISGRRRPSARHHGRCRRRRGSASGNGNGNSGNSHGDARSAAAQHEAAASQLRASALSATLSSTMSSTLSSTATASSSASSSPTSENANPSNSNSNSNSSVKGGGRRGSKKQEAPGPEGDEEGGDRRLRITTPVGSRLLLSGWERGQPADVRWEPLDKRVQFVRIDVCNEAWTVPTTIAHRAPNDGAFRWRRVYWGMPIADGYFVNVYDATEQTSATDELPLLAQSERFAVIR